MQIVVVHVQCCGCLLLTTSRKSKLRIRQPRPHVCLELTHTARDQSFAASITPLLHVASPNTALAPVLSWSYIHILPTSTNSASPPLLPLRAATVHLPPPSSYPASSLPPQSPAPAPVPVHTVSPARTHSSPAPTAPSRRM
jgi:hypothetical protein